MDDLKVDPIDLEDLKELKRNFDSDCLSAMIWGINRIIEDTYVINIKSKMEIIPVTVDKAQLELILRNSPMFGKYVPHIAEKWNTMIQFVENNYQCLDFIFGIHGDVIFFNIPHKLI